MIDISVPCSVRCFFCWSSSVSSIFLPLCTLSIFLSKIQRQGKACMPDISSPIFLPWCTRSFFRQLQYSEAEKLPEILLSFSLVQENHTSCCYLYLYLGTILISFFIPYLSEIVSYIPQMRPKPQASVFFVPPSMCNIRRWRQALSVSWQWFHLPSSAGPAIVKTPFSRGSPHQCENDTNARLDSPFMWSPGILLMWAKASSVAVISFARRFFSLRSYSYSS